MPTGSPIIAIPTCVAFPCRAARLRAGATVKIATRIALLQWQANPADPSNFMRLVVAWVTPGMREPTGVNGAPDRPRPDRPSQSELPGWNSYFRSRDSGLRRDKARYPQVADAPHRRSRGNWGMTKTMTVIFGIACMAIGAAAWQSMPPQYSAQDQQTYDTCLAGMLFPDGKGDVSRAMPSCACLLLRIRPSPQIRSISWIRPIRRRRRRRRSCGKNCWACIRTPGPAVSPDRASDYARLAPTGSNPAKFWHDLRADPRGLPQHLVGSSPRADRALS